MPTFPRQTPLTPEGEYTGIIKGAGQQTSRGKEIVQLKIPIRMPDGKSIVTYLNFPDETHPNIPIGLIHTFVKNVGLEVPNTGEPQISPDDIEGLQVWFGVKHNPGPDGRIFANVYFHSKTFAISQNPTLASVVIPGARKPGKLRGVLAIDSEETPTPPPVIAATQTAQNVAQMVTAAPTEITVDDLDSMSAEELKSFLGEVMQARRHPKAKAPTA